MAVVSLPARTILKQLVSTKSSVMKSGCSNCACVNFDKKSIPRGVLGSVFNMSDIDERPLDFMRDISAERAAERSRANLVAGNSEGKRLKVRWRNIFRMFLFRRWSKKGS